MVDNPDGPAEGAKISLRDVLRERRSLISAQQRHARGQMAAERLARCLTAHGIRRLGLFASIRYEIPTEPAFHRARALGVEVALPKINPGSQVLNFGWVEDWTELVLGRYHIPEPLEAGLETNCFDAIVVPGLGFDARGGRLGYGAGWYDRTLETYSGWIIGYGFDVQVVEAVPMEPHDRRLDLVVTDERTLATQVR